MARRRSDLRIDARRRQPHRRVLAIVEGMQRVVRGAGMLRVLLQNRRRDGACFQRYFGIAPA